MAAVADSRARSDRRTVFCDDLPVDRAVDRGGGMDRLSNRARQPLCCGRDCRADRLQGICGLLDVRSRESAYTPVAGAAFLAGAQSASLDAASWCIRDAP